MSDKTSIQWTNSTWNPIRARHKPTNKVGHYCEMISSGCANCYASTMQPRFGMPEFPGQNSKADGIDVFLDREALAKPLSWKRPRMVFVCSMTDLFGHWVKDEWLETIFAVMAACPKHRFQILTKRPGRMMDFCQRAPWFSKRIHLGIGERCLVDATCSYRVLPNVWLGVTVENNTAANGRIPILRQTPAAVRFLSCEPLLERLTAINFEGISWVIVGGESGRNARRFQLDWARDIVRQCRAAGVSFFMKQAGSNPHDSHVCKEAAGCHSLKLIDPKGGDLAELPEDVRVREFPTVETHP